MLCSATISPTRHRKLLRRAAEKPPPPIFPQRSDIPSHAVSGNMALRNIRPSFSEVKSGNSAPSQSSSEALGSNPRYLTLPADNKDVKTKDSAPSISKRRRVPDSITRNACMNCKKARAKCDGQKPCSRCDTRSETASCVYEVHIKHAKEELMKQITDLRAKDRQSERIYKALRSDIYAPRVIEALRKGEPHEEIVEWLERDAPTDHHDYDGYSPAVSNHEMRRGSEHAPLCYWTNVKDSDSALVQHLLQLYFAWVHPVHTLFSERHFCEAFQNRSTAFCSSLLVNAMCALACTLRSDSEAEGRTVFDSVGENFAAAFEKDFDPMDKRLTTIQATAIMFLVELSRGKASSGPYLKLATENIIEVSGPLSNSMPSLICKPTIQGIRNLDVEWAQATFRCPQSFDTRSIETVPDDHEELDSKFWYFYRFEGDQTESWPSHLRAVNREKVKLISIISDSCALMYGASSTKIRALDILGLFARYQSWYTELPPQLQVGLDHKSQALPHVLSLLILYNHSVTQLLRPLVDLPGFPSVSVEEDIFTHTQRGIFLLEHYRTNFTGRFQPILQMFSVACLCDTVARFYPARPPSARPADKDGSEAIIFGLEVLQESYANGSGFLIAGTLRELLRLAPSSYTTKIAFPQGWDHILSAPRKVTYEEIMDACRRATYFQPLWGVREKFESGLGQNWLVESVRLGMRRPEAGDRSLRVVVGEPDRGANYLMQIKNLLNDS